MGPSLGKKQKTTTPAHKKPAAPQQRIAAKKQSTRQKKAIAAKKPAVANVEQEKMLAEGRVPFKLKLRRHKKKIHYRDRRPKKTVERDPSEIFTLIDVIKQILPLIHHRLQSINWRQFVFSFFRKNKLLKIFSIVASLFVFFYMKSQDISDRDILIPLQIKKSQELSIANEIPASITVFVSGTKDNLLNLDVNGLYAEIDATSQLEGENNYRPILKGFPGNVQILRTSPNEITLTVSPLERKLVEIVPELIGAPHPDYYLVRYSVKPKRLWVTGPNEILADITTLQTEPISIENIKSNREISVTLNKSVHPRIEVDRTREFSIFLYLRSRFVAETIEGEFFVEIAFANKDLYTLDQITVRRVSFEVLEDNATEFDAFENLSFYLNTDNINSAGVYTLSIAVEPLRGVRIKNYTPRQIALTVLDVTNTYNESSSPLRPPPIRRER